MSPRPTCGNCAECQALTARKLAGRPTLTRKPCAKVTAEALERHARRFGPEGVAEAAEEHGVDVTVERPRKKVAPRGPSLKKRVARHLAAGRSVEFIAEWENLTPGRARRLVEEVKSERP